ncbi:MAG: hypothetical protein JHC88_02665 [Niveispirillum sp.]|nr:hypothetical protein [Niveispirillum sp.]
MSDAHEFNIQWTSFVKRSATNISSVLTSDNRAQIFKSLLPMYDQKYQRFFLISSRVTMVSAFLWIAMFSYIVAGELESEIGGFHTKDVKKIKEITLIAASLLTAMSSVLNIACSHLSAIINEINRHVYGVELSKYTSIAFSDKFPDIFASSKYPHVDHYIVRFILLIMGLSLMFILCLAFAGYVVIISSVIADVYMNPAAKGPLHTWSLLIGFSCAIFWLSINLLSIPFPQKNYSALEKLSNDKSMDGNERILAISKFTQSYYKYTRYSAIMLFNAVLIVAWAVLPFIFNTGNLFLDQKYIMYFVIMLATAGIVVPNLTFWVYKKLKSSISLRKVDIERKSGWRYYAFVNSEPTLYWAQLILAVMLSVICIQTVV